MFTGAATQRDPLTVCPNGHLVINGNKHWKPEALDHSLARLICVLVDHGDCE